MSRRSSGFTGANAIPLGPRNRAIGGKRQFTSSPPRENDQPAPAPSTAATAALKAAQAAAANLAKFAKKTPVSSGGWSEPAPPTPLSSNDGDRSRPRKKKSRWATDDVKTVVPGMPTTMPTNLTPQQEKAYIAQLQIEDITRKLKSGDLGIPPNPEDRSPSPEPIYNGEGKRMNTREYRTRKKLEEERHKLIQEMTKVNEDYKPPADYKPLLQRVSERVAIPSDINPNINFVGLLIGPRGNTLKKIEKESNCKIMIRGKGSVKEGKVVRKDNHPLPGEDEPLHALVSSNSIENVKKAVNEIREIIKSGIEQPEEENDLRKLQLMELAKLNGTLREDLVPRERQWLRPENQNITNTTICPKCGGRGHLAQDCRAGEGGGQFMGGQAAGGGQQGGQGDQGVDRAKMDSEYMSLMAELGEAPAPAADNQPNHAAPPPNNGGGGGGPNPGPRGPRPMMQQGNNGNGPRYGGPRPPWMGPRGPHGHGPRGGPRYGPRNSGGYGNGPGGHMIGGGRGGPPPPWMQHGGGGGYGGNHHNQWGAGGHHGGGYQGGGGYQHDDGNNMQGGWSQGGNDGYGGDGYGYGSGDNGGGYGAQPPPPPPTSAPQPPPPPSSNDPMAQWQQQSQQWSQQPDNSADNYGGWGTSHAPPMPSGPGPVPPPPPSSGQEGGNEWGGYAMPPAPPPPPPQ